ncbi:CLUMA_CG005210, isoform A [Clunio marinus]|uniref:CLUMA_CG005210, isoform A n=1 Tax=Clunio marinus TaxID=568069 RepID=A0A1J1HZJ4_9DIPT|nr:CLUMA_CG005210, isoform A [Clunio marinus]
MNTLSVTHVNSVSFQHGENLLELTTVSPHGEMPEWGYMATATVLFFIGFFGFFLNFFVIVLMCRDIQIWTPMNIILLNLVCSDLSVSIIGNPITLTAALHHGWVFGETVCVCYGFFMSLLGITSITTLTVLSYERYCLVSCPFSSSHLTKASAKTMVAFIWLYSLTLTTPPLFGWGKYVNEAANISCSVNWETKSFNATSYIVFLFVFGLVVPLIVIVISYIRILITLRKNALRAGRVNKVESKVTNMIFVMILAFFIAWTPYSIFALSEQFGDPDLITPAFAVLPALIAKSSICYNPLIYVGMNSQFRAAWRRVCGKETNTQANINDTIINQISSDASAKVYIDCSFTKPTKKRKNDSKEKTSLMNLSAMNLKTTNENLRKKSTINTNIVITKNIEVFKSPTQTCNELKYSERNSFIFQKDNRIKENRYELRMFSSEANIYGKAINQVIRANSYKSNVC